MVPPPDLDVIGVGPDGKAADGPIREQPEPGAELAHESCCHADRSGATAGGGAGQDLELLDSRSVSIGAQKPSWRTVRRGPLCEPPERLVDQLLALAVEDLALRRTKPPLIYRSA